MKNVEAVGDRKRRSSVARFLQRRDGGTHTAAVVLAIALLVSIIGSVVTYVEVHAAFTQHNAVDQAQALLAKLFRQQLEEDSRLRGFLASGQKQYLNPYSSSEPDFDTTWLALREASAQAGLQSGDVVVTDLRHSHDRWKDEVAQPLIAHPAGIEAAAQQQLGKALVDRMGREFNDLNKLYDGQATAASETIQALLLRAAISTAALILLFGFAAIVADLYRSRTQVAFERERVVADTLQRAFLSGWDSVPYLRVGTAYVSSTAEAAVGGDLFDIHRIDDHRSLVLVADVSGKGLNAAVETAQVKYSVRTLVEDYTDPAVVLAKFNRTFIRSLRDPTSFVTAFVGIFDDRDWTLRYSSAGHAPVYVRRSEAVEQLPVTGPVLGVSPDVTFSSVSVAISPGDTIVLATDGLTEARDSAGVLVDDDGVIRWIRDGEKDPERLAAELISRVTRFAGGGIKDDLALLIIRLEPVTTSAPVEAGREDGSEVAAARASTS